MSFYGANVRRKLNITDSFYVPESKFILDYRTLAA